MHRVYGVRRPGGKPFTISRPGISRAWAGATVTASKGVFNGGRVTYTSFHNEARTTADMDQLLEQMLLGL